MLGRPFFEPIFLAYKITPNTTNASDKAAILIFLNILSMTPPNSKNYKKKIRKFLDKIAMLKIHYKIILLETLYKYLEASLQFFCSPMDDFK